MSDIKKDFGEEENVIKYKKHKGRLFINACFLLLGVIMFPICLKDIINAVVYNKVSFDINGSYVVLLFSVVCLLVSIRSLLSYFGNKIIISESFIKIKRAVIGRKYIIPKKYIEEIGKVFSSSRGFNNYQIIFYLINGKKIKTGYLNCKNAEFDQIYSHFNFKEVAGRKDFERKRAILKSNKIEERDLVIKTNYLFPILSYFLLIVFIVGVSLLGSGFNYKYGMQQDFNVSGTVVAEETGIKNANIIYRIVVLVDNTSEKQRIDVSKAIYQEYEINNKVNITGKKGSLGILYDISFSKGS